MGTYLKQAARSIKTPPQSLPLSPRQVANSAGGYSFPVDDWKRLERFLILGSEGGSYYASEQKLTLENAKVVERCIAADGLRTISTIVEISVDGRAPKNDPALMALALCAGAEDANTRTAALDALPKVARIGTHLFHFASYVQETRGWGRGLKRAVKAWYQDRPLDSLVHQLVKYQQRDGWSHRDLLRLSKPVPRSSAESAAFAWAAGKGTDNAAVPTLIAAFEEAKTAPTKRVCELIRSHQLTREMVPTEQLTKLEVWEALLENMPLEALLRNLGNLSKVGVLKPLSAASKDVCARFADRESIRKARLHPIKVLVGAKTYASGHGLRGSGEWPVVAQVVDALDDAFYLAFDNVEPTGKRFYLGLDISGSMWSGVVAGVPTLNPAVASGAMAMVTVKSEKNYYAAGFTCKENGRYGGSWDNSAVEMTPISISPKQRLDSVLAMMEELSARMGGTDCALPMLDALEKKLEVDTFIIYTDSETWAGSIHPTQALQKYRQKTGIPAKLIVVGMVSNGFSIAGPQDAGMLDVVGFDTAAPAVMADFSR